MSTKTFLDGLRDGTAFENETEQQLRRAGVYAALIGAAFVFLIPYLWMIGRSFQTQARLFASYPYFIPTDPTLRWFEFLTANTPIVQWTINTFIIAGGATVMVLIIDSMVAYSLTRLKWPARRIIFSVIVASFMVPGIVNLIPVFQLIIDLGLLNEYLGVILPAASGPIGVFMLVQFFKDFPDEIEESARLDGFSTFQIYSRLVLPLMKPALTALGLFIFIWTWNSYLWPLVILQNQAMYTLPIGLVTIRDTLTAQQPGLVMASSLFASIPLFVIFIALQGQLVRAVQLQGTVK